MPNFRFSISTRYRKELAHQLRTAQQLYDWHTKIWIMSFQAVWGKG